jgi:hypothetical protein
MVLVGLPTLLVVSSDFDKKLSLKALMIPITTAWGLLIVAQIYAWYRACAYHKRVITLHLTHSSYKLDEKEKAEPQKPSYIIRPSPTTLIPISKHFFQNPVKGRNAKHCSLYTFGSFINRFAMANMLGLSFMYLGFFLKIYILEDKVTYLQMAPISISPLILMYLFEMASEVHKDRTNWKQKNPHLSAQMAKESMVDQLQGHNKIRRKINCGLIPNFLVFTLYHAGFFCLLCLRLDK